MNGSTFDKRLLEYTPVKRKRGLVVAQSFPGFLVC